MNDALRDVRYWSNELERLTEELQQIRSKLCDAPIPDLTYEERFKLREVLVGYYSLSHLLKETLDKADAIPAPVPFYKRLFRKK